MKKTLLLATLFLSIGVLSGCIHQQNNQKTTQPEATNAVEIKGFAFNPTKITISKGTTVTWTQKDNALHTVTSDNFDSRNLSTGQTFSQTFNEAGTFKYICTIHPSMEAEIIVN